MAKYKYNNGDEIILLGINHKVVDLGGCFLEVSGRSNSEIFDKLHIDKYKFFREHGIETERGDFPFIKRDQFDEAVDLLKEECRKYEEQSSPGLFKPGEQILVAGVLMEVRKDNDLAWWLRNVIGGLNRSPFSKVGIEDAQKWCLKNGYISKINIGDWPYMNLENLTKCANELNRIYYSTKKVPEQGGIIRAVLDTPMPVATTVEPEKITLPKHNIKSFKINL